MKKNNQFPLDIYCLFFVLLFNFTACNKKDVRGCTQANIPFTLKLFPSAHPCKPLGKLEFHFPQNSFTEISLNNGPFAAKKIIDSLLPGNYNLRIRFNNECYKDTVVTMPVNAASTVFSDVKKILQAYCMPCHEGFNPKGGLDFNKDCIILSSWDRIEARAVLGNPSPMPQNGLIPLAERNKIADWIRAGHGY